MILHYESKNIQLGESFIHSKDPICIYDDMSGKFFILIEEGTL